MKSLTVYSLSIFAVVLMVLIGFHQMNEHQQGGIFFVFVGSCTAIGLTIDMVTHIKARIRKNNVRKLHP